jgi:predicted RNA-binding Zn ribbon-like protein
MQMRSHRRGSVSASAAARLKSRARGGVEDAMAAALSLRAEIWKIADTPKENRRARLGIINGVVAALPPQPTLSAHADAYPHDLPTDDLRAPLWPVLWSLTAVLTSTDASRLGCCQAEGCGWFYVDESRNRTRMWCSSEVYGNRERLRRAHARRTRRKARPP